jgi:DNA-binding IclR family transcriptional regulator
MKSGVESKLINTHGTQLNQSLIDGINLLQALSVSEKPSGVRELARYLELDANRVSRLLRTLAYLGLARQTNDRKYTTGSSMHVLAAQSLFASQAITNVISSLEGLFDFNLVVAYGVLWKDKVTYLFHALPGMSTGEALGRLGHFPATASGVGLSLLSALSDDEINTIYADKPIPYFNNDLDALLSILSNIREQGYARVNTKYQTHISNGSVTIAVNVGDPAYGGVALSGQISEQETENFVTLLRGKAHEIELKNRNINK